MNKQGVWQDFATQNQIPPDCVLLFQRASGICRPKLKDWHSFMATKSMSSVQNKIWFKTYFFLKIKICEQIQHRHNHYSKRCSTPSIIPMLLNLTHFRTLQSRPTDDHCMFTHELHTENLQNCPSVHESIPTQHAFSPCTCTLHMNDQLVPHLVLTLVLGHATKSLLCRSLIQLGQNLFRFFSRCHTRCQAQSKIFTDSEDSHHNRRQRAASLLTPDSFGDTATAPICRMRYACGVMNY